MSILDWLPWVRERRTRELADEMRTHLDLAEEDLIARGESPGAAADHAKREFGNVGLVQEIARDTWGASGMSIERFLQDVRFALRMLRKSPGFATVTVLTIALGIGATTAIFSVVNATLLHALPYPHSEQLVRIQDDLLGVGAQDVGMSTPEWKDLQRSGVFEYVSPVWFDDNNLTGLSRPQRVGLMIVAPNYFALLGVQPQLGAVFDPGDPTPGFNEQAVIGDGLWKRAFGKDPAVVGKIVQLDSDSYRIIGVMPPGFQAPGRNKEERSTEVWPAMGFAGAPITTWARRSLLGAVSLVLLIGCANVANLLLSRASARGREMAVRQALGGEPGRLTRQLLTESVVLSVLGGVAGVVVLVSTQRYLVRLVPESLPRINDIAVSWGVLFFAFGVSLVTGVVFGLAPALHIRRLDVTRVLKQEGRGSTASREQARTRRALVVAEFALSLVLMIVATLLLRSFWELAHAPLGFDARGVTLVHSRLPYPNDPKEDLYATAADEAPFARELLRRLRELLGVQEAALGTSSSIPLDHPEQNQSVLRVVFEGRAGDQPSFVNNSVVTPEYFHLLGIPLVRGRLLTEVDNEKAPLVAVINEAMARKYWPNENPVGRRVKLSPLAAAWTTVIGVVADARTESIESAEVPVLYASVYQRSAKHLAILLRGRIAADVIEEQVRAEVQSINAALPVFGATSLEGIVSGSLAARRFAMDIVAAFALTALLLAGLGIYGVISYMVSERTHEIGVRLALGAQRADVTRMVLRQGLRLGIAGGCLGLAGAALVARLMSSALYGVSPADPLTFGAVAGILTAIALGACYIPARRATRVDPIVALR